jgi:hypothetical protein
MRRYFFGTSEEPFERSMSSDSTVPEYSRQGLRKATRFVEGDYKGINPREFYRRLKRRLEEVQTANDFKYETRGDQRGDLQILSEEVGEKTGRIEGRLIAESDWELLGEGTLDYKPYGPHGALAIVLGLLVAIVGGVAQELAAASVGILVTVAGGYFYFKTDTGNFPLVRKDIIRVLMTGEVSERTIEDVDETRTDIFANMSVIYAGDTFVNVHTKSFNLETLAGDYHGDFTDLAWPMRRALVKQVKRWTNEIVVEDQQVEINDGFLDHLSAWSNRNMESDRRTIDSLQSMINESFDVRLEYTETLLDQLSADVAEDIKEQQQEIDQELQELAEDMDVYVEREGLERTTQPP